jgi:hypothetical protein
MDELQVPDEIKDLWRDSHPREENMDMIVEEVLRDARKFEGVRRSWDVAGRTLLVVLLPLAILAAAGFGPLLLPGLAALAALAGVCLLNTRKFYRLVGSEPALNRTAREHLAWSLTYLEHREELYRSNWRWGRGLYPAGGILLLIGMFRSYDVVWADGLVLAAVLLGFWVGNEGTKCVLLQIEEEKARLQKIRDEFADDRV